MHATHVRHPFLLSVAGVLAIAATVASNVSAQVSPSRADVSIVKAGPSTIAQAAALEYILTVRNAGPTSAAGVVVTDAIPAGLTVRSAPGCVQSGSRITCAAGVLASGEERAFRLAFAMPASTCGGLVKNTATVASATIDPFLKNNTSNTVSTRVTCPVQNRLTITVQPAQASDTAVRNQRNIRLLGFNVHDEGGGSIFTNAVFDAQAGTLSNAKNYSLWVDADGNGTVDTVLQSGVAAAGGKVLFDRMIGEGYIIPPARTVLYEVHADVAASLADPRSLQLKFATSSPNYVKAYDYATNTPYLGIKTDGACAATCEITVDNVASTAWTFADRGNLFVTRSLTPLAHRQLLGGALADAVLRLRFAAQYEDIAVTALVFTGVGTDASRTTLNVDRLELFRAGEATPFAYATVGGCGTATVPPNSLCATMQAQELVATKGAAVEVLALPRMRADVEGAISGNEVTFVVAADSHPANGSVRAFGIASNAVLSQNDNDSLPEGETFIGTGSASAGADIVGLKNVVVMSKAVSIVNANPAGDGTAVPNGISAFGQFRVSAASHLNTQNGLNKWALSDMVFTVQAANVAMDAGSFAIYNKGNPAVKAPCAANDADGTAMGGTATDTFYVVCANLLASPVVTQVAQGADAVFVLEGKVTNPKISSAAASVLQASLQSLSDTAASSCAPSASHVRWIDQDGATSRTFFWIDLLTSLISSTRYQS